MKLLWNTNTQKYIEIHSEKVNFNSRSFENFVILVYFPLKSFILFTNKTFEHVQNDDANFSNDSSAFGCDTNVKCSVQLCR